MFLNGANLQCEWQCRGSHGAPTGEELHYSRMKWWMSGYSETNIVLGKNTLQRTKEPISFILITIGYTHHLYTLMQLTANTQQALRESKSD